MINELIYDLNLIKDEINQIKKNFLNSFNEQKIREDENLINLRGEIESLRDEINSIKQNSIEDLKKQAREENENINIIKKEVQTLKENQSKKVDLQDFNKIGSNLQNHQQKDKNEKDAIQKELINLKQIVKKSDTFLSCLNKSSKIFGTTMKDTNELYLNGKFKSKEFLNQIDEFTEFIVEIEKPSPNYYSIYSNVLDMMNSHKNISISIFINQSCYDYILLNSKVKYVSFDSSVTSIGECAFERCSSLTQITIPSSITSIGDGAFGLCSSLTQITIPSSVTSIGNSLFYKCSSLTQVTFITPSSVTLIDDFAFEGCSSLAQIAIPSSVTSIGYSAFRGCSSLIQVTIPSSVTSIDKEVFSECSSLTQIMISSTINRNDLGIPSTTKITEI